MIVTTMLGTIQLNFTGPAAGPVASVKMRQNSNLGRKARGDYFRQWWASRGLSWSLKSFSYKTVSILSLQGGNEVIGGNW